METGQFCTRHFSFLYTGSQVEMVLHQLMLACQITAHILDGDLCGFLTSSSVFVLFYLLLSSQSEMKTSGSSQQSECNPVGALQVIY